MITRLSVEEITLIEEIWRVIVDKYFTVDYGNYENINIDPHAAISPATIVFAVFIAAMTASAIMIFNKRVLGRLIRRLISRGGVGYENAKTLEELGMEKSRAVKLFINKYALSRAVRCREEDEFYGIDPSKCDEEIPSIGVENTEAIKVPFWRRKADARARANACSTTVEGDSACVATEEDIASHLIEENVDATQNNDNDATQKSDERDAPEYEDAYSASLLATHKYKRKPTDHFYIRPSQKHRLAIRYDIKGTNPLWLLVVAAVCLVGGSLIIKAMPWLLGLFDGLLGTFNSYDKY